MQLGNQSELSPEIQFFTRRPILQLFIIGFLFISALGIRLYHIQDPPLDFQPTRQYHSALIAKGYYFESLKAIPEWRRRVARLNKQRLGILEPQVMELMASFAYRLAGGEHLWIPRVLSSIFWLIGGALLFLIAKDTVSTDGAVFSTAYYLFLPYGILASRSFQPDPMMVMMLLLSILLILRYYHQPSRAGLAIATTVSALAMFIKPVCLFPLFGAYVSLSICRHGIRRFFTNPNLYIFLAGSLVPTIIYYGYGTLIAGFHRGLHHGRFLPHLLLRSFYWSDWLSMIGRVVGYAPFIGALLGVLMVRKGLPRALLIGLWVGYVVFGLVFNAHIHTHDYYHLQFIPIVALSLGPIGAVVMYRLSQETGRWSQRVVVGILLVAVLLSIRYSWPRQFLTQEFKRQVMIAQKIGEDVGHSTKTIFLAPNYGLPIIYHGELAGRSWPRREDFQKYRLEGRRALTVEERFNTLRAKYSPEYFIVTDPREFRSQVDLRDFLATNFPILSRNPSYIIFDLRKRSILGETLKKR